MTGVEELDMATAKRQHAQAPRLQETAVEAMFLEELADLEEDSPSAEEYVQGTQPMTTPHATARMWTTYLPESTPSRPEAPRPTTTTTQTSTITVDETHGSASRRRKPMRLLRRVQRRVRNQPATRQRRAPHEARARGL